MAYSEANSRLSFSRSSTFHTQTMPTYRPPNLCVASVKEGEYLPRCTTALSETFQFPSPGLITTSSCMTFTPHNGMSYSQCPYRNPMFIPTSAGLSVRTTYSATGAEFNSKLANDITQTCDPSGAVAAPNWAPSNFMPSVSMTPTNSPDKQSSTANRSHKRKMDINESGNHIRKVFVNEERMSAHMQQLHLDNNNLSWHPDLEHHEHSNSWLASSPPEMCNNAHHQQLPSSEEEDDDEDVCQQTSTKSINDLSSPEGVLRLAPELRKLGEHARNLLPSAIVDEINKSAMQVVLWKPPGDFISTLLPSMHHAEKTEAAETPPPEDLSSIIMPPEELTNISLDGMDISAPERPLPDPQYRPMRPLLQQAFPLFGQSPQTEAASLQMIPVNSAPGTIMLPPLPDSDDDMEL